MSSGVCVHCPCFAGREMSSLLRRACQEGFWPFCPKEKKTLPREQRDNSYFMLPTHTGQNRAVLRLWNGRRASRSGQSICFTSKPRPRLRRTKRRLPPPRPSLAPLQPPCWTSLSTPPLRSRYETELECTSVATLGFSKIRFYDQYIVISVLLPTTGSPLEVKPYGMWQWTWNLSHR